MATRGGGAKDEHRRVFHSLGTASLKPVTDPKTFFALKKQFSAEIVTPRGAAADQQAHGGHSKPKAPTPNAAAATSKFAANAASGSQSARIISATVRLDRMVSSALLCIVAVCLLYCCVCLTLPLVVPSSQTSAFSFHVAPINTANARASVVAAPQTDQQQQQQSPSVSSTFLTALDLDGEPPAAAPLPESTSFAQLPLSTGAGTSNANANSGNSNMRRFSLRCPNQCRK